METFNNHLCYVILFENHQHGGTHGMTNRLRGYTRQKRLGNTDLSLGLRSGLCRGTLSVNHSLIVINVPVNRSVQCDVKPCGPNWNEINPRSSSVSLRKSIGHRTVIRSKRIYMGKGKFVVLNGLQ